MAAVVRGFADWYFKKLTDRLARAGESLVFLSPCPPVRSPPTPPPHP
jgi:hypothetical protein